jgi:pyruvate/2-oxoglutarate/acetoin dehydrogenase E1 component
MTAAIRCDDPVIFVEHRLLHGERGDVPEAAYEVQPGQARVLAEGRHVTLVGISHMATQCLRARTVLAASGIDAEVVDPVWLAPLDMATILRSAKRTGHLLVVDNAWTSCGASAEILARTFEDPQAATTVTARRLGFAPVTCPTTRPLEDLYYPDARSIAAAAERLVRGTLPASTGERVHDTVDFRGPF